MTGLVLTRLGQLVARRTTLVQAETLRTIYQRADILNDQDEELGLRMIDELIVGLQEMRRDWYQIVNNVDGEGSRYGSTFTLPDHPCPSCGERTVIGFLLIDELGRHQSTRYVCTFWRSGINEEGTAAKYRPCGWEGWSVPDPNEVDE